MKLSDRLADDDAPRRGSAGTRAPVRRSPRKAAEDTPAARAPAKRTTATRAPAPDAPAPKPAARRASTPEDAARRWEQERAHVRSLVIEELGPRLADDAAARLDAPLELEAELTEIVDRVLRGEDVSIPTAERARFTRSVLSDVLGYGPLDVLLQDPDVDEVMCNDFDDVWVERHGRIERTGVAFLDRAQYRQVIDRIVQAVGRRVDESSPMVDARLPDGSRVNAVLPPIAVHGPTLTIRKFSDDPLTVEDLVGFGSMTDALAQLLEACVRGELNILISGGTGSGKTTLLNVMSSFIPEDERIITLEDAAELQLQQPHVITMESRPANAEGRGEVTIRDLVRNALRMRPDRIVVGEVRGSEALDMLQAMNTGHEGSMTTVHANAPRDALSRIETLCLMAGVDLPERAIREQLVAAIDLIVQIRRLPDGRRRVVGVTEVQGLEGTTVLLQDVYAYDHATDALAPTGLRPRFLQKLGERGVTVPRSALTVTPAPPAAKGRKARR